MLRTLAYRIPASRLDAVLGQVTAYPLDQNFAHAWGRLPKQRQATGRFEVPPYRQLASGLTAVHGQPVRLFDSWDLSHQERDTGTRALILTRGAVDERLLRTAFRAWEKQIRDNEDRNTLAPLLPAPSLPRFFSDFVTTSDSGTADGPGWLFNCAQWGVMSRLAAHPLLLDRGVTVPLRLDTDGCLLGWDSVLVNTWRGNPAFAMARITCKVITMPGVPDLVLRFDAHLSRLDTHWRGVDNAWIDRDDPNLPVLRVAVKNVPHDDGAWWSTHVRDHTAEIAEACGLERLSLDQELPPAPGRVRPLVAKPRPHPIGKGPGARFMLRLAEHVEQQLPELQTLTWDRQKRVRVPRPRTQVIAASEDLEQNADKIRVRPETVSACVHAAGYERLHLVCLYSTSPARQRMTDQLAQLSETEPGVADDQKKVIGPGLAVSFHHSPQLLAHGAHDRTPHAQDLRNKIGNRGDDLLLAWAETEWAVDAEPPKYDAKNSLRRLLAQHKVATQFLATPPANTPSRRRRRRANAAKDYASSGGLHDLLLRTGGVIEPRMAPAILGDMLTAQQLPSLRLVGVHARLQTTQRGHPKFVLTAVAVRATADPDTPWVVEMYSDPQGRWVAYPDGLTDFHSEPIGNPERGRSGEKAAQTRLHMESVLDALGHGPTIVYVDAGETRTIWPGLQNRAFRRGLLPASGLANSGNELAIVRCNVSQEVPRPIDRAGGHQPRDPRQPAAPDRQLYRLGDTEEPLWLLPKSSRTYRGKGGSIGARYTRWTLPNELGYMLADDWHSYTGTEIAVLRDGCWTSPALAGLTARLCDHPVSYDDRTRFPLPLHLAATADRDHPDYRSDVDDSHNNAAPGG